MDWIVETCRLGDFEMVDPKSLNVSRDPGRRFGDCIPLRYYGNRANHAFLFITDVE